MLAADFVTGSQWYVDALPQLNETIPRIVVTVWADGIEIVALLDTGASYCVVEWEVGKQLLTASVDSQPQMRALGGNVHHGHIFSGIVAFPADGGEPLAIPTTMWTAETFHGPNLVGYAGLLEKMRFAVDPSQNRFYFGA